MIRSTGGPGFDDLRVGDVFDRAPAIRLTDGLAAAHQAIVGDRLALALDGRLACEVAGGPIAPPALVWDVAIGQSTVVTQRVRANLFYRGLVFRSWPYLGDTLTTRTEVLGLRRNQPKPGRTPTGLAALRVSTTTQDGVVVLDFVRCAMLPARSDAGDGHRDDLAALGRDVDTASLLASVAAWDLGPLAARAAGPRWDELSAGDRFDVEGGDVVSSAAELARLGGNIASVHHDGRGGARLVYGGHTIGLALHQAARAIPGIVGVPGWFGCDHLAPVHEGDILTSVLTVEEVLPRDEGGALVSLRCVVTSHGDASADVLDWRFAALVA